MQKKTCGMALSSSTTTHLNELLKRTNELERIQAGSHHANNDRSELKETCKLFGFSLPPVTRLRQRHGVLKRKLAERTTTTVKELILKKAQAQSRRTLTPQQLCETVEKVRAAFISVLTRDCTRTPARRKQTAPSEV
jgi:hypothetical protein